MLKSKKKYKTKEEGFKEIYWKNKYKFINIYYLFSSDFVESEKKQK